MLAEALAEAELAETKLERVKRLAQTKAVEESSVAEHEQALRIAKSRAAQLQAERSNAVAGPTAQSLAISKSKVERAKAVVEAAQDRMERYVIRSRIDDTVLTHNVQVGAYVQPGELSIKVANLDRMEVTASVPEKKLPQLRLGLKCRINTVAGDLDGIVKEIAPVVENGTIDCVIVLDESEIDLLPGMTATIALEMPDLDE